MVDLTLLLTLFPELAYTRNFTVLYRLAAGVETHDISALWITVYDIIQNLCVANRASHGWIFVYASLRKTHRQAYYIAGSEGASRKSRSILYKAKFVVSI